MSRSTSSRPLQAPGAKADRPQRIPRRGWVQILKRGWAETMADQLPLLSAGVAFFGFLALFPTLIALVLAYGLFADPSTIADQVRSVSGAIPSDVQDLIVQQLAERSQQTGALSVGVIISLVVALWSASGGVANLMLAINTAYDETDRRSIVAKRGLALLLTLGAIVFMIVLVTLVAVLPVVFAFLPGTSLRWLLQIARWVLIALLIMAALAVLYRVAPDRTSARLVWTSPGAIVATVVWLLVSAGFSLYVTLFASYAKTYGALAGIVVLLMWLWLTSFAVLFGAEINAEAERQTFVDTTVGPNRPLGRRGAVVADTGPPAPSDAEVAETPGGGDTGVAAAASAAGPGSSDDDRGADLETELAATRGRLAENVGALAAKADVKAQLQRKASETGRRMLARAEAAARRSPATVAAAAAAAGVLVGLLLRGGRSG